MCGRWPNGWNGKVRAAHTSFSFESLLYLVRIKVLWFELIRVVLWTMLLVCDQHNSAEKMMKSGEEELEDFPLVIVSRTHSYTD